MSTNQLPPGPWDRSAHRPLPALTQVPTIASTLPPLSPPRHPSLLLRLLLLLLSCEKRRLKNRVKRGREQHNNLGRKTLSMQGCVSGRRAAGGVGEGEARRAKWRWREVTRRRRRRCSCWPAAARHYPHVLLLGEALRPPGGTEGRAVLTKLTCTVLSSTMALAPRFLRLASPLLKHHSSDKVSPTSLRIAGLGRSWSEAVELVVGPPESHVLPPPPPPPSTSTNSCRSPPLPVSPP